MICQHQPPACALLTPASITAISAKLDMGLLTFQVRDSQALLLSTHIQCRAILCRSLLPLEPQAMCMLRASVRASMSQLHRPQTQQAHGAVRGLHLSPAHLVGGQCPIKLSAEPQADLTGDPMPIILPLLQIPDNLPLWWQMVHHAKS